MSSGRYQFDREQLSAAHESCQRRAEQACLDQRGHIVIDNSNLRNWEYSAYAKLAARHQYLLLLQEPQTTWRRDPARLAAYNCHQVQEADLRWVSDAGRWPHRLGRSCTAGGERWAVGRSCVRIAPGVAGGV